MSGNYLKYIPFKHYQKCKRPLRAQDRGQPPFSVLGINTIGDPRNRLFPQAGGEEFAIIAPGIKSDQAVTMAEKIRASVESRYFKDAGKITINTGVAEYSKNEAFDNFYKRTNNALYRAKTEGRNIVRLA